MNAQCQSPAVLSLSKLADIRCAECLNEGRDSSVTVEIIDGDVHCECDNNHRWIEDAPLAQ